MDLLPRFYDVDKGSITIDGTDVRDATLYDLRSLMGNVNQEAILFNDTFFNNISFGVEGATLEQVQEAARTRQCRMILFMASEDGYDTNIGDRGGKLSGRTAPAYQYCTCHSEEPADPDPRRGDFGARHRVGTLGAGGFGEPDA